MTQPLHVLLCATLLACSLPARGAAVAHPSPGPAAVDGPAALAKLLAGNQRYAAAHVGSPHPYAQQRVDCATDQHPFAVIVACSDSRVAPEIVFDQGLGELFVIRTAGNLVDDLALGSIEYAVEHLGVRLVLVVGHERCGAVTAAVDGAHTSGHVRTLVQAIKPAIRTTPESTAHPLEAAIAANARAVADKIRRSRPALSQLAHAEVTIASARYDLDTGVVTPLE